MCARACVCVGMVNPVYPPTCHMHEAAYRHQCQRVCVCVCVCVHGTPHVLTCHMHEAAYRHQCECVCVCMWVCVHCCMVHPMYSPVTCIRQPIGTSAMKGTSRIAMGSHV